MKLMIYIYDIMHKIYYLREAFTLNATGQKVNAVAEPANKVEIIAQKKNFSFNFYDLPTDVVVYKVIAEDISTNIQGLVAFKTSPGVLDCVNMEVSMHNKKPAPVFGSVGKAMVAICCKYSFDNGMDG